MALWLFGVVESVWSLREGLRFANAGDYRGFGHQGLGAGTRGSVSERV